MDQIEKEKIREDTDSKAISYASLQKWGWGREDIMMILLAT
jgi:hypothetical protein